MLTNKLIPQKLSRNQPGRFQVIDRAMTINPDTNDSTLKLYDMYSQGEVEYNMATGELKQLYN